MTATLCRKVDKDWGEEHLTIIALGSLIPSPGPIHVYICTSRGWGPLSCSHWGPYNCQKVLPGH